MLADTANNNLTSEFFKNQLGAKANNAETNATTTQGTNTAIIQFFIGKPNPLMMRFAMNYIGIHSGNTIMIGDRMDTDMIAGIEAGLETILVLTGVSTRGDIKLYPYRPNKVAESIADIQLEYRNES